MLKLLSINQFQEGEETIYNCTYKDGEEIYEFRLDGWDEVRITEELIPNANNQEYLEEFIQEYNEERFVIEAIADMFDNFYMEVNSFRLGKTASEIIIKNIREGNSNNKNTLKNFLELLDKNVSVFVREQFLSWIDYMNRDDTSSFTILPDGSVLGYKGCTRDEDGALVSIHTGPAYVDGEYMNGHIPNKDGSVITMDRVQVEANPYEGCSVGLHIGSWDYASNFAHGKDTLIVCKFDPRDVVSVPTDCEHQKVRVCKYEVIGLVREPLPGGFMDDDFDPAEYLARQNLLSNDFTTPENSYIRGFKLVDNNLIVKHKNKSIVSYKDFNQEMLNDWLNAESFEDYFEEHIYNNLEKEVLLEAEVIAKKRFGSIIYQLKDISDRFTALEVTTDVTVLHGAAETYIINDSVEDYLKDWFEDLDFDRFFERTIKENLDVDLFVQDEGEEELEYC